jgi:hypothetical protein
MQRYGFIDRRITEKENGVFVLHDEALAEIEKAKVEVNYAYNTLGYNRGYTEGYEQGYEEGYQKGREEAEPVWHSVSEKPENNDEKYIIRIQLGRGGIYYSDCWYSDKLGWWYSTGGKITHWMLPPEIDENH